MAKCGRCGWPDGSWQHVGVCGQSLAMKSGTVHVDSVTTDVITGTVTESYGVTSGLEPLPMLHSWQEATRLAVLLEPLWARGIT